MKYRSRKKSINNLIVFKAGGTHSVYDPKYYKVAYLDHRGHWIAKGNWGCKDDYGPTMHKYNTIVYRGYGIENAKEVCHNLYYDRIRLHSDLGQFELSDFKCGDFSEKEFEKVLNRYLE